MKPYFEADGITLWQGDSLAILRNLPDKAVDALITDPPYSSGGMVRGDRMNSTRTKYTDSDALHSINDFTGDNRDQRAYGYWCALWLSECLRITKPGGLGLLFTDWRQLPSTSDSFQAGGWVWRGIVPWVKPSARPMSGRFTNQAEYVVWGSAGPMGLDFTQDTLPGFYQANAPRDREHITQKPVDVMRKLVRICPENGTVLDPFMGSGTTGVAATLEGRSFIGCELSDAFTPVAERRIREALGHNIGRAEQDALEFPA